jgi:hypothetical protein
MFGSKWVIVDGLDTNINKIEVDITLLKQTGIVLSLFRKYCGFTALSSERGFRMILHIASTTQGLFSQTIPALTTQMVLAW